MPVFQDLVLVVVDGQLSHRIGALLSDLIIAAGGAGVADGGADAGQQLVGAEGLGQVVVSTQVQGGHFVFFVGAGGNDHHREAGPAPELAQNIQAVHVGQPQIQNDEVRTVGGDHGNGL